MSAPIGAGSNPFGPRGVLALVGIGALAFVALLYALGSGLTGGSGNDGGGHALSRGLTGYAALADLARRAGMEVTVAREERLLRAPGLLVLTPPHDADGGRLARLIEARRTLGPTLLVVPKWTAIRMVPGTGSAAKSGWVLLAGTRSPGWIGELADGAKLTTARQKAATSLDETTPVPLADPGQVQGLTEPEREDDSRALLGLIEDDGGRMLAAYVNDDGVYPALDGWSGWGSPDEPDETLFPLVIVAEPDLLDNYGLAKRETALAALRLVRAAGEDGAKEGEGTIVFDVTLNGLGRTRNLLTLAFTPPFLAATLALLMAAFVAGWRAFNRFGPPRTGARAIAYGKTALVENSAGLIRRAGRLRLLGAPYAALVGARLVRLLGLPPSATAEAIDLAQARRGLTGPAFTELAAALAAARTPHDLIRRAAALRSLEKALTQ